MSKKTTAIIAFLSGAAAGAAFGMLYAPYKGRDTRDLLSFRLEKYRDLLRDLTDEILAGKDAIPSAAKSEGQKVIQDAKTKAEQLLNDVDSLINQINSRKV
ncbi:MAG TPA: YtxH domain-containing protein [Adhaeribacter sp.]|nr:YtxH domain-containing protein [Adhaeribacter sp.]